MNLGKTLIIQASPGIGDMIWHLPYLRGIAKHTHNGRISLLTKSRNFTKDWLSYDPIIDKIHYIERRGLTRSINIIKNEHFDTVWVLHRSFSYTLMAFLAGVPHRYGFGYSFQRYLLTEKNTLQEQMRHTHTIDQVKKLLEINKINCDTTDLTITLPKALTLKVRRECLAPSIALGIGGSEQNKRWPLDNFVNLILSLNTIGYKNVYLCGGPSDEGDADLIMQRVLSQQGSAIKATLYPIDFSLALMEVCDFYIGNDSALLNAAVCLGTPALGLFGATTPLTYSPLIHSLTGKGMDTITSENVMAYFMKHLYSLEKKKNAL